MAQPLAKALGMVPAACIDHPHPTSDCLTAELLSTTGCHSEMHLSAGVVLRLKTGYPNFDKRWGLQYNGGTFVLS